MSDIVTNLAPEIRGLKAAERGKGHTVAGTGDVAQAPAVVEQGDAAVVPAGGRQRDFPIEGARGPALQGAGNHFGWKPQGGLEIRSYVETIAVREVAPGEVVSIEPTIATIWRILAAGNLTIQVADLPQAFVGGEQASRVLSLTLIIQRNAGSTITWPPGTMFGSDVLDPDGDGSRTDSLLNPPTSARMDVFVLCLVPTLGWIGFVSAQGLAVA